MLKYQRKYFILVILSLVFLVGCEGGSYKVIMGEVDARENSIIGEYNKFSGNYYKRIKLNRNDEIFVKFEKETKEGSLRVNLTNSDGEEIFSMNGLDKVNEKRFIIKKDGYYKMRVIADDHKGSFDLQWDIR